MFDVYCTTPQGKNFIVEVQVEKQEFFGKRGIFYSHFPIIRQAPKGRWDYDFHPVRFLGIVNFKLKEWDAPDQFLHMYSIREDGSGRRLTDDYLLAFLEVGRFNRTWEECGTFIEKFLFMMKNLPTLQTCPSMPDDDGFFADLMEAAEFNNLDPKHKIMYTLRIHSDWDNENVREYAIKEARREGLELGREEGEKTAARQIARELLSMDMSVESIAKATGLDREEILKL